MGRFGESSNTFNKIMGRVRRAMKSKAPDIMRRLVGVKTSENANTMGELEVRTKNGSSVA